MLQQEVIAPFKNSIRHISDSIKSPPFRYISYVSFTYTYTYIDPRREEIGQYYYCLY